MPTPSSSTALRTVRFLRIVHGSVHQVQKQLFGTPESVALALTGVGIFACGASVEFLTQRYQQLQQQPSHHQAKLAMKPATSSTTTKTMMMRHDTGNVIT